MVDVSPHIWSWVWTCMAVKPVVCTLALWCNGSTPDWQSGGAGLSPGLFFLFFF